MSEKVEAARTLLKGALDAARSPVLWCSFGIKSLVVFELIRELGFKVPLLWMRIHELPEDDHRRLRKMIRELDLEIIDYRPTSDALSRNAGDLKLIRYYSTGGASLPLLFEIHIGSDEDWQKTVTAILAEPKRKDFSFAWDISFLGATSGYFEEIDGSPLPEDGARLGRTLLCFPLRDWTPDEISGFADERGLRKWLIPQ